ncbi:MAG: glycosyltransferase [Bacteroidota bacterium]
MGTSFIPTECSLSFCRCAGCSQPCALKPEVAAFVDAYENGHHLARPDLLRHCAAVARLAAESAVRLIGRGLATFGDGCAMVLAAGIHDFGHVLDLLPHRHCAVAQEDRHTHRMELHLRLSGQDDLAQAVRHSAPMVRLDAARGTLTLAQLVVCHADAQVSHNGEVVGLDQRLAEVERRHGAKPGWHRDDQDAYGQLLKTFDTWLKAMPFAAFGRDAVAPLRRMVFVERCDGRYATPISPLAAANSVHCMAKTRVARQWSCAMIAKGEAEKPPVSGAFEIGWVGGPDPVNCAQRVGSLAGPAAMAVGSWLGLFETGAFSPSISRVLLLRGLRRHRLEGDFFARIARAVEHGLVNEVVTVSSTLADLLAPFGVRARVIENGLSHEFQAGLLPRPRRRQILFAGAPIPSKGIEYLASAVPPLRRQGIEIVVAGIPGIYGQEVKTPDYPGLRMAGFVEPRHLAGMMAESLAVVVPTQSDRLFEGFGKSALESLACGTPVIVSDCGHLPAWTNGGETGWVLDGDSPDALADTVARHLPALLAGDFAPRCREVASRYSWEATAWKFDRLFDELQARALDAPSPSSEPIERRFQAFLRTATPELPPALAPASPAGADAGRRVVAVEPHPDDIAYSAILQLDQLRRQGWTVEIVTCFPRTPLASFRHVGRFVCTDDEYARLRAVENHSVLVGSCGFAHRSLGMSSAALRGYPSLSHPPMDKDSCRPILRDLFAELRDSPPDMILVPAGLGRHPDHLVVHQEACARLPLDRLRLYTDVPYLHDPERAAQLEAEGWRQIQGDPEDDGLARKIGFIGQYLTQIPVSDAASLERYVRQWVHPQSGALESFWVNSP